MKQGTLAQILREFDAAWVCFGRYGAIVTEYGPRVYLNLAVETPGQMDCQLKTFGSRDGMLEALYALSMPRGIVWNAVEPEQV